MMPADWLVKRLGEVAVISSGGTPRRDRQAYWNGKIPWITTSQIDFTKIEDATQFITAEGLKSSACETFA
ncbi:restriction endonuclease subunit S [Massilia sp. B-10]|nr:restriction endonuclease subunit S [Massilia sp. B-10]